jgi:drug/metabolite transporter (DMT)-like permease
MALIPQLIGHTAMNWSLKHFTAAAVGAATLLEPIFAAALAWWLFHESVTPHQALGALILLIGVSVALSARASNGDPSNQSTN